MPKAHLFKVPFQLNVLFCIFLLLFFGSNILAQSVKVSSYGFDTDPSNAFYLAMQSSNDTLILDKQDQSWVLKPMHFKKIFNKTIIIEKGVEIEAEEGSFTSSSDALFRFTSCNDIKILGNDTKLCMNKSEYIEGEWRHGISLRQCKDIIIRNLIIQDTGGDGIYISGTHKGTYSENITIENVVSKNNKRQGMSIISAKKVNVVNCVFKNTKGTLPGAGLDLEPNTKYDLLEDIVFRDCTFKNNDHAGIVLALRKLETDSKPISISFLNCLLQNNHDENNKYIASEIVFGANKINPVKGEVYFEDCIIENSKWGLFYSRKTANAYNVTFKDCKARNICKDESFPAIYLEVPDYYTGSYSLGGYTFENLEISYTADVPVFQVRGSSLNTLVHVSDINGEIVFSNQNMNQINYIKYDPKNNKNVDLLISHR